MFWRWAGFSGFSGFSHSQARLCAKGAADVVDICGHARESVIGEVHEDAAAVVFVADAGNEAFGDEVANAAQRRCGGDARSDAEA